jgi:DNA-binding CsgD family transcriptional regulator
MTGPRALPGQLTERQLAVVRELALGHTYAQIGRHLGMTTGAATQVGRRAALHLGATTVANLVARAIGLRLIPAGIALTDADRRPTPPETAR